MYMFLELINFNLICGYFLQLLDVFYSAILQTGFEIGAPAGNCLDGYPGHGHQAQTNPSPYSITISTTSYNPGVSVTGRHYRHSL